MKYVLLPLDNVLAMCCAIRTYGEINGLDARHAIATAFAAAVLECRRVGTSFENMQIVLAATWEQSGLALKEIEAHEHSKPDSN